MNKLRIGVIGVGAMGANHLNFILNIRKVQLTCICDIDIERANYIGKKYNVKAFYHYEKLLKSGMADAVLIATPHYIHTPIAIDAFKNNIHVLAEKPVAAHIADAQKMIDAYKEYPSIKWGIMFQQRNLKIHQDLKRILDSKEFGRILRINYTITDWYRTQSYYNISPWRATWVGEGGGVLLNQSVHQLDLLQWFFGMPEKIRAFCGIGKYHNIEVEDEVTAYLEYAGGMNGVLVISCAETPGLNRLEIVAENGKILMEGNEITKYKNSDSGLNFIKTSKYGYAFPEFVKETVVYNQNEINLYKTVIEDFADAVFKNKVLSIKGEEGYNSLIPGLLV